MSLTINDVYIQLYKRLRAADSPQPELEARELTAYVCHADKRKKADWAHLYLDDHTVDAAHALCEQYLAGKPLAYLIGEWDFYGLTFRVTPDVLIPRPDTETLCAEAIAAAKERFEPRVLDLCCGSGCIGIALAHEVPDATVYAADISTEALLLARENAGKNAVAGQFYPVRCDALATPDPLLGQFDVIACNPPYITADEMRALDRGVAEYEPVSALYGGEDGLDFYRAVTQKWQNALKDGGRLLFEVGYRQAQDVMALCREAGLREIRACNDLAGIARVVCARKP